MKTLTITFLIFVSGYLSAQKCQSYFPVDEGREMEISSYNSKDKLTGTSVQKILKKESNGDNLSVTVGHQSFDEKGKELGKGEFIVRCENGIFYLDMRNYLDDQTMAAYENMEIEVQAKDMEFPNNFDVGQTLPDASIDLKVKADGEMVMLTVTVNITNRKVESKETISTAAGEFECFKMTFDIETKMMIKVQAKVVEWVAKDVGMVRSETYNNNGKLQGYSVLTGLK
jgi:hypothetical protein